MTAQQKTYADFCQNTEGVSLFAQAWWLDAICGSDGWDVALAMDKNGAIQGALAYPLVHRWGFSLIKIPILTDYSALWLRPQMGVKEHQKQSFERAVLADLIRQIPRTSYAYLYIPPQIGNWQPFYKANWRIETLMTHQIDLRVSADDLFRQFKENTQNKIRKSAKSIRIEQSDDTAICYQIYEKLMQTKGLKMSYSLDFLQKIHAEIRRCDAGKLYTAVDQNGDIHAMTFIVWDKTTAYYWICGSDLRFRNSGAQTYLIFEMLKDVAQRGIQTFDFVGSREEGLESFFSGFGAVKKTYFKVFRYQNRLIEVLHRLYKG